MTDDIKELISALPDDEHFIPDEDLFRATFFNLNPSGNFHESYRVFELRFGNQAGDSNPEGTGVYTYKYFCNKYDEYINWWNSTFGDKDPKYIGKADKLRDPAGFFEDSKYAYVYAITKQSKDYYIFGSNSMQTLRKKLYIFKTKYLKQEIEVPITTEIIKPKPKETDESPF